MTTANALSLIVANAATKAIVKVGNDTRVPELSPKDVEPVANAVHIAVRNDPAVREVSDLVNTATTPIPWYQSRVAVGLLVAGVSLIIQAISGKVVPQEWQNFVVNSGAVTEAVGIALAGFGRLRSKLQPMTLT
jgi:hypothetical protein